MTSITVSFKNTPKIYRRERERKKVCGLNSAGSGQQPLVEYCEIGHEISRSVLGKEICLTSRATLRFPINKSTLLS